MLSANGAAFACKMFVAEVSADLTSKVLPSVCYLLAL